MNQYNFKSGTAVVTGAAGGIGRAVVFDLADLGANIALIDRDEDNLKNVIAELKKQYPKQKFTYYVLDLTNIDQIPKVAKSIIKDHSRISLLVNNAGIALNGTIEEVSMENFEQVLTINFRAQVYFVKELLPALKKTPGSQIANVSSLFGLIGPAGQSAYTSSKFAVRGFSDVIRSELKKYNIGVTTIYPAGIKTKIASSSLKGAGLDTKKANENNKNFEKYLKMTPERAAEIIIKGIQKRKTRVLIGSSAVILDIIARMFPGSYGKLVEKIMK